MENLSQHLREGSREKTPRPRGKGPLLAIDDGAARARSFASAAACRAIQASLARARKEMGRALFRSCHRPCFGSQARGDFSDRLKRAQEPDQPGLARGA